MPALPANLSHQKAIGIRKNTARAHVKQTDPVKRIMDILLLKLLHMKLDKLLSFRDKTDRLHRIGQNRIIPCNEGFGDMDADLIPEIGIGAVGFIFPE